MAASLRWERRQGVDFGRSPASAIGQLRPFPASAPRLLRFAQQYDTQHGQMAAAAVIATVPALLLMAMGQRFIVHGLTMGSVK
jgi:ABC-type glycerol-3-phosphate transport system permease component